MRLNPNLSRRRLLERWWVVPVAGTLGAFGYMGWYASRVTLGKREAGEPEFEAGDAVRVAARWTAGAGGPS